MPVSGEHGVPGDIWSGGRVDYGIEEQDIDKKRINPGDSVYGIRMAGFIDRGYLFFGTFMCDLGIIISVEHSELGRFIKLFGMGVLYAKTVGAV